MQTEESVDIDVKTRDEFLDYFAANYGSGQHVLFLGPTQRGKTTLCHQMLARVISPERRTRVLAGKPPGRDHVMGEAADNLNLRITEEWPPAWSHKDRKKNGYVVRPKHSLTDIKADSENLREQFRKTMVDSYASQKDVILVCDETHHVQNEYKLKAELEAPLMRGAPVCAVWMLVQRGRYITYMAYDASDWVLVYNDPDRSNRQRYAEIGGVDPRLVEEILSGLRTGKGANGNTISECLCIRRSGPELFIVGM